MSNQLQSHENMNSDDIERLLRRTAMIREPGTSRDQLMDVYENWEASGLTYDQVQELRGYKGPTKTANRAAEYVEAADWKNVRILDVGAGTGLVAEKLVQHGFTSVDALEPSTALVRVAEEKGVYKNVYKCFMTEERTPGIEDDSYDGIVTCGCFMENHLPVKVLDEMIRVVKSGGIIVIVTRLIYLTDVSAYKDKLEPYMTELEEQGKMELLSREEFAKYYKEDKGVAWVFRKI